MRTALVAAVAFSSGLTGGASQRSNETLVLATLSSRPRSVSGGDALVEIQSADATVPEDVVVSVNGRDVSRAFHRDDARRSLVGLIEGLQLGRNTIVAVRGSRTARLEVTNFPITGPILSGEHLTPFECRTEQAGLGPPLDANCSAPTRVEGLLQVD